MSPTDSEEKDSLKKLTWQSENCLACVWFRPNDPINADIMERGMCINSKLKTYDLIVSGRDWCNLFKEIKQQTIDMLQEKAMKTQESEK
jgi:hypothetical protein